MPTRLEVLLQRRKSAAAEPFHRHRIASASAGTKPAVTRAEKGLGRRESSGIIQGSYINSLMISRDRTGLSTAKGAFSAMGSRKSGPRMLGLPRDMAKSVTTPI